MQAMFLALFVALVTGFSLPASADSGWRKYESGNFIVYSDYSEKTTLKKIRRFELFKQSIHELLGVPEDSVDVPFEVYLFKSKWQLRKFTTNSGGFYRDRLGYPLMVVGPGGKDSIFFHEYVHYLTYRLGNFVYPRWYSEGIAEFYSTLEFKDGKAIIGGVPEIRRGWLARENTLPLASLLEPEGKFGNNQFTGRFYATAWLLTHRMILGAANGMDDRSDALKQYLLRYTQGEKAAEVFFEEMGEDAKAIANEMRRYARQRHLNAIAMPLPDVEQSVDVSPLSNGDLVNIKVRLALAGGDWDYASELLADNRKSLDGEGLAALAIVQGHESDEVGTEAALISRLMEDPELSGAGHAHLGHALFDLAEKNPDNRRVLLAEAAHHLEAAQAADALYGESRLLIEVYWELGRRQSAMNEILRVIKRNPASLAANQLAGEYSLKAGLREDAQFFLTRVVNWAHSEAQAERALQLLAEIEGEQLTADAG